MTSRPAVELVAGEVAGRMEGVEVRQLMNELLGAAAPWTRGRASGT